MSDVLCVRQFAVHQDYNTYQDSQWSLHLWCLQSSGGIEAHKQQVIILPGKCYNIIGDRSIFITIFSGALKMHCQNT